MTMSLWDTMLEYTSDKNSVAEEKGEAVATVNELIETPKTDDAIYAADILFVATNLDSWEADDIRFGYEVMLDVCYRQLDAPYYAYLRNKMTQAKEQHESGKISPKIYDGLRTRFNVVHAWAMEHIGEQFLQKTLASFNPRKYVPPSQDTFNAYRCRMDGVPAAPKKQVPDEYIYPPDSDLPFTEYISPDTLAKVNIIRDEAIRLGWTHAGLYQNCDKHPFPYGQDYGLVCFLSGDRSIGEVTSRYIEIVASGKNNDFNRFYNLHVDQPWISDCRDTRK